MIKRKIKKKKLKDTAGDIKSVMFRIWLWCYSLSYQLHTIVLQYSVSFSNCALCVCVCVCAHVGIWFVFLSSRLLGSYTETSASPMKAPVLPVRKHWYTLLSLASQKIHICQCPCMQDEFSCRWERGRGVYVCVCVSMYHISVQTGKLQPLQSLSLSPFNYNSVDRKMPIVCVCICVCLFMFSLICSRLLMDPVLVMKPVCVYVQVCVSVWEWVPSTSGEIEPGCWHSAE